MKEINKYRVVRVWYVEANNIQDAIKKSKSKQHNKIMVVRRGP